MTQSLDSRFKLTKSIIKQSATQTDTGVSATAKEVVGSRIALNPREAGNGTTYRWVMGGAIGAGGNGAAVFKLYAGGTAIATLTMAQSDAADWFAEIICVFVNYTSQKCISRCNQQGEESAAAYDAGTADCSNGIQMFVTAESGNASDSIQVEVCFVEKWDYGDMVTA